MKLSLLLGGLLVVCCPLAHAIQINIIEDSAVRLVFDLAWQDPASGPKNYSNFGGGGSVGASESGGTVTSTIFPGSPFLPIVDDFTIVLSPLSVSGFDGTDFSVDAQGGRFVYGQALGNVPVGGNTALLLGGALVVMARARRAKGAG